MGSLKECLQADMKSTMKSGEKERLGVIRLILSAIKQREVDERISLDDTQVIAVLDKMVKQRRESIAQYESAGRVDLSAIEQAELLILQAYLPHPFTEEELDTMIREALLISGASGLSDMGKVMAILKPKMQGRADMAQVSLRIKQQLTTS